MNRMILTVVHDCLAKTYSFPHTTVNEGTAVRDFQQMAKTPGFPVEDVELLQVGEFDPDAGVIYGYVEHKVLVPRPEKA